MDRVRTSVNELSEQYGLELKCLKGKFRYNLRSQKRFVACQDCRATPNIVYTPPDHIIQVFQINESHDFLRIRIMCGSCTGERKNLLFVQTHILHRCFMLGFTSTSSTLPQ